MISNTKFSSFGSHSNDLDESEETISRKRKRKIVLQMGSSQALLEGNSYGKKETATILNLEKDNATLKKQCATLKKQLSELEGKVNTPQNNDLLLAQLSVTVESLVKSQKVDRQTISELKGKLNDCEAIQHAKIFDSTCQYSATSLGTPDTDTKEIVADLGAVEFDDDLAQFLLHGEIICPGGIRIQSDLNGLIIIQEVPAGFFEKLFEYFRSTTIPEHIVRKFHVDFRSAIELPAWPVLNEAVVDSGPVFRQGEHLVEYVVVNKSHGIKFNIGIRFEPARCTAFGNMTELSFQRADLSDAMVLQTEFETFLPLLQPFLQIFVKKKPTSYGQTWNQYGNFNCSPTFFRENLDNFGRLIFSGKGLTKYPKGIGFEVQEDLCVSEKFFDDQIEHLRMTVTPEHVVNTFFIQFKCQNQTLPTWWTNNADKIENLNAEYSRIASVVTNEHNGSVEFEVTITAKRDGNKMRCFYFDKI